MSNENENPSDGPRMPHIVHLMRIFAAWQNGGGHELVEAIQGAIKDWPNLLPDEPSAARKEQP